MAISNWAAQRSLFIKSYNQRVKKLYKENPSAFERIERLSKVQALEASLILAKDSQGLAKAKQDFFHNQVLEIPYTPNFYQTPDYTNVGTIAYDPQIVIVFMEKKSDYKAAGRTAPLRIQVSLRLKPSIVESLKTSDVELSRLSNAIETSIGRETYRKGRRKFTYKDDANKHRTYLHFQSETEARQLWTKVLALQNQVPDFDRFWSESNRPTGYFSVTRTTVFGEVIEYPEIAPLAECTFYQASAHVYPAKPRILLANLIDHL